MKILTGLALSTFLIVSVGSYLLFSNLLVEKPQIDLNGNFQTVLDEVESYGGAMIVKYDTETGEIISKRSVNEIQEIGEFTVTQEEARGAGITLPSSAIVIPLDISPSQAVEYGGNN